MMLMIVMINVLDMLRFVKNYAQPKQYHLGNTRAIVGSDGTIITEKDYERFGKPLREESVPRQLI